MITREELARLALEVLDLQREYFDRGHLSVVLARCKALEKELRQECERVLEGPMLFPEPPDD